MARPETALPRILYVEGTNDREVVYQLCNRHEINNRSLFEVHAADGINTALDTFKTAGLLKVKQAIGLIIDADQDVAKRWREVAHLLLELGHEVSAPDPRGWVADAADGPRLGVWLMPDNTLSGALEDFVAAMVPPNDALWPIAEQAVLNIPAELRLCPVPKARIHTWLAWQAEPGTPMGQAITKRYLDADHPSAQALVAWLRRLFVEYRGRESSGLDHLEPKLRMVD